MRAALSLLIAAILLFPPIVVTARTPSPTGDPTVDGGPDLMPPQPGVQSWPGPRTAAVPFRSPGPAQTTGTRSEERRVGKECRQQGQRSQQHRGGESSRSR